MLLPSEVEQGIWDTSCQTMVPFALPTTLIPHLDCLSHAENQIKHHVAIVPVTDLHCGSERSQVTCIKQLLPGYSEG